MENALHRLVRLLRWRGASSQPFRPVGDRQRACSRGRTGPPTSRSTRPAQGECGIAYGARVLGRRSVRSSRCAMRCAVVSPAQRVGLRGSGVVAGQNSCNDSWPTPASSAAPSIRLRCTTSGRSKASTPHRAERTTGMGRADGLASPQDPRRLPRLPRRHPLQRKRFTADMMSTGEPDATETGTSGSGRGRRFARSSGELKVLRREPKDVQRLWGGSILGFVRNSWSWWCSARVWRSCRAALL